MDAYQVFGALGVAFGVARYGTYIYSVIFSSTKPHLFTWASSALSSATVAYVQFYNHAGPGSYVTAVVTLFCTAVSILTIRKGDMNITVSDAVAFGLSILCVVGIFVLTNQHVLLAVVILSEFFIYYPSFRKAYFRPYEEDARSWTLSGVRWVLGTLAVSDPQFLNIALPLFYMAGEFGFVAFLLWRRMIVPQPAAGTAAA